MKSLSWRAIAGRPKRATDCGTFMSITFSFCAALGSVRVTGVSFALAGSPPKMASRMPPSVLASMSPTTATRSLSLREGVRPESDKVGPRDLGHRLGRAVGRPAVGMSGKRQRHPLIGGDTRGIALGIGEVGQILRAHALDRFRIEARLVERQRQQRDRPVAVLGERLEAAVEGVAAVIEAHAHGQLFHALLELLGRQIAGAFIQHAGKKIGHAFLAGRVLRAAALERKAHGDERNAAFLDQPGRDASRALDLLDFHCQCPAGDERRDGGCKRQDQQHGDEPDGQPRMRLENGRNTTAPSLSFSSPTREAQADFRDPTP